MQTGPARLAAGTAGASITPDRLLPLEGYGRRTDPATGTLDPVEVRAIVFDDGTSRTAIVAADLGGIEAASVERIRTAAAAAGGIPSTQIIVTYSHTHGAPAVTPFGGVAVDVAYVRWVEQTIAEVVVAASRRLQPVTVGGGEGHVDFNVNRRRRTPQGMLMRANPAGVVDRRVRVLRVDPADGPPPPGTLGGKALPQCDPVAVLFAYACHPTVLRGDNTRYSGDYPAAARRFVEQAYRSDGQRVVRTEALFLPGCFGNMRPNLLSPDGDFRGGTDHELTVLGRWLGSEVLQVAENICTEPVGGLAVGRQEVQLPYSHVPDEAELHAALGGRRRFWAEAMLAKLEREGRLPESEAAEVQVLRLGHHWVVALPGETTLEIGLAIERGLVELGLAQPERGDLALVLGYANSYVGYLCSASVMTEGGYEPATSYPDYFRPAPFGLGTEPALVQASLSLAQKLGAAPA